MEILRHEQTLGEVIPNMALLVERNVQRFGHCIPFQEKRDGHYQGIFWNALYKNIVNISANLTKHFGFHRGDKMIIFSPNRREMLELELAVMASGGVAVPIFAYFRQDTAELLIRHSDARFIAVAGELQLSRLSSALDPTAVFVFDAETDILFPRQYHFSELLSDHGDPAWTLCTDADPGEVCLNMYTSGTMGVPKCVQLTHQNILSQQAAVSIIWNLDSSDRFLSYLPWHHSFGGIFELFTALYSGATLSLESGYGKDPDMLFENWKRIQPTVFFSVPRVYRTLLDLARRDRETERLFFHPDLKFVFTAAAPLPQALSQEFEMRNIPVIEGWGLTETSPCCTLTDPQKKRHPGIVGHPIPGVTVRTAADGEIQVQGPNVMQGYYKNDEANEGIFTEDGFFCTGDIGEITPSGLRLVARKDRIFKLSNGEKVVPSDLERMIETNCHYISFAMVVGSGEEYPVALLFPNKKLLDHPDYRLTPGEGCFCPRTLEELERCLHGCLTHTNREIGQKFSKLKAAMIIDDELSFENNTLTPSLKVAPRNVVAAYATHIETLYGSENQLKEDVYIIKLEDTPALKSERR
jgi:long-subunit acyl-CoA synthetase (AMP-forming)